MYILIKIYAPKHSLTLLLLVVPQDTVDRGVSQQGPEALTQVPKYNRLRKKTQTRHLSSLLSQLCPFRAGLLSPIIASSKSTKLFLWSNPVAAGDSHQHSWCFSSWRYQGPLVPSITHRYKLQMCMGKGRPHVVGCAGTCNIPSAFQ